MLLIIFYFYPFNTCKICGDSPFFILTVCVCAYVWVWAFSIFLGGGKVEQFWKACWSSLVYFYIQFYWFFISKLFGQFDVLYYFFLWSTQLIKILVFLLFQNKHFRLKFPSRYSFSCISYILMYSFYLLLFVKYFRFPLWFLFSSWVT